MRESRKNKLLHFVFLKSLNLVILLSLLIAILLTLIAALVFNKEDTLLFVIALINVFLVAAPLVLFVVCIISSIIFSINLSKQNIAVNKLSHFESLLRIKTVCLEKENVIVDSSLIVKKVIPLKTVATEQYIDQWLSNLLRATNNSGAIFDALNKQYDFELSAGVVSTLNYNDGIKYSGVSFKGGKTIVLGDPEFIPIKNKTGILKRCEEDINKGCHILVLGEGKEQIGDDGYRGELEAIALIILKEHVRDGAFETFKWFKDNNVDIKVISCDNPLISSAYAAEAGIPNADNYISLSGIETSQIEALVPQYTVFGNATSEQKAAIIKVLKKEQEVMMIGGAKDDSLAMNASSFAVATIGGDYQKDSDVVLNDSSLNSLQSLIEESKAFMGNMQKILAMSLAKTALAILIVVFFIAFNSGLKQCLFVFNHLLLWDLITNGIASFLLIFDKKNKKTNPTFLNISFKAAVPMMILQAMGVLTVFALYALQSNKSLSIGLYSMDDVAVVCVLLFVIFGVASLYNICFPLNQHRRLAVILGAGLNILAVTAIMLIAYLNSNSATPYLTMNAPAYFIAAVIAILYSTIYLFINRTISIVKGDKLENEN